MDINELCNRDLMNEIFDPLIKKFPGYKKEIEQIKFSFKNAHYNKNRLVEQFNLHRNGISFDKEKIIQIADPIGLKPGKRLEIGIPITLWSDVVVFEFHGCLLNIIRTVNFLLDFKLRKWDEKIYKRPPSIAQYLKNEKKYCKQKFYKEIKKDYFNWIENVNEIRNEVIHRHIRKKMQGHIIFHIRRLKGDKIKTKGDVVFGIKEYDIENLESFLEENLENLKFMILIFFEKFFYEKSK